MATYGTDDYIGTVAAGLVPVREVAPIMDASRGGPRRARASGYCVWAILLSSGVVQVTAICRPTSSASKRLRGRSSRTLFERSPVASLVIDEAALILDANRAARSAIDAGAEQLYGTPLCELFAREHHREVERAVRMAADTNARASERAFEVQLANRHRGDTRAPAASFVFAVETLGKGELLVALADISTLKQAESVLTHSRDRLHQLANRDSLTGIANRRAFDAALAASVDDAQRAQSGFAVLFLDLNGFKSINDELGHRAGDEVLRVAANRLARCVRRGDIVARHGGDEFAFVLTGIDAPQIRKIAEKIHRALAQPITVGRTTVKVTTSIGASVYPRHGESAESLVEAADTAMYQAKRAGGRSVVIAEDSASRVAPDQLSLVTHLTEALDRDELALYFQPQLDAARTVVALDADVRWYHPRFGTLRSEAFVPMAIDQGIGCDVDAWVIEHVGRRYAHWCDMAGEPPRVSIPLSTHYLALAKPEALIAMCERASLPPSSITLVLDADATFAGAPASLDSLEVLARAGFRIGLDNFGCGRFADLVDAAAVVNQVRLHRTLAREYKDPRTCALARAAVSFCTSLGIDSNVGWIDSEPQLAFFKELGCSLLQGAYLAPAMTAQDVIEYATQAA